MIDRAIFKFIVKRWCRLAGVVGTDFETAYKSWTKTQADNVDGLKLQAIVKVYARQD